MASGQTSNIGLNQWEPGDQVLREEFNADNVKIDTALQSLEERKSGFVKLLEATTTEQSVKQFIVDVSGIRWGEWQYVMLDVTLKGQGYVNLLPNGQTGGYTAGGSSQSGTIAFLSCTNTPIGNRLTFQPCREGERTLALSVLGNSYGWGFHSGVKFKDLTSLHFVCSHEDYHIRNGSRLVFWGIK